MSAMKMMKRVARFISITAVVGGMVGCAAKQPREAQYVQPGEVVSGTPEQPTMYDLESSAQMLIEKMLSHP